MYQVKGLKCKQKLIQVNFFPLLGLVTLMEMRAKQEDVVKAREKQLAKKDAESRLIEKQKQDRKKQEKMKVGQQSYQLVSFRS